MIIDREDKEKTSHYKPQGLRWSNVNPTEDKKALSKVIDVEKNYSFRPYSNTPHEVTPMFFYAKSSGEVSVVPRAGIPPAIYFLLAITTLVLLPSKMEGSESIASYSPQRILL